MPLLLVGFLYNLSLLLLSPIFFPFLAWRLFTGKETGESLREKLGFFSGLGQPKNGIWIHAVSVGEVLAAVPLAEALVARGKSPVIFSVSTQTGMGVAKGRLSGKAHLTWFPLDFPFAVRAALKRFSPSAVVFMETEIWPNFLMAASSAGVKCVVANGRISDKSFGRYKTLSPLLSPILRLNAQFLMQSEADAGRMAALGVGKNKIYSTGNIKFDKPAPTPLGKGEARDFFRIPKSARVVVFASTHPGEDELFLEMANYLSGTAKEPFFVIAPRHVERAASVAELCEKFRFTPVLRSSGKNCEQGSILILDTMGELAKLYETADVAVMGGSFVKRGGQNPLEAAVWKIPVIFGPHMENFREISQKLLSSGAAKMAKGRDDLAIHLKDWTIDQMAAMNAGEKGLETVLNNRGALAKTLNKLEETIW